MFYKQNNAYFYIHNMQLKYENNFPGYFKFYHSVIGGRLFVFIVINILVGLLDGLGLAMFVPLLSVSMKMDSSAGNDQMLGKLHFITDFATSTGISLSLLTILILLILLFSLKGVAKYFQVRFMADMRRIFLIRVRLHLIDALQDLSYNGFLKLDAGRIQNSFLTEVSRLFSTMTGYFSAIQYAAMLITYVTLAFLANAQFAIFVAIGGLLTNFIYKRLFRKTGKASVNLSKEGHRFNGYLVQAVNHFKYLRATNYFSIYAKKLKTAVQNIEFINQKMGHLQAISEGLKEPIAVTIVCLVIYIEARLLHGDISSIFVSLLLFYRALTQFGLLQSSWQSFMQNIGGMVSISTIAEQMKELKEPDAALIFREKIEKITLHNVEIAFPEKIVLSNINLEIEANTTIAFAGESGVGKTSLAGVIMGLFPVSDGQICINGHTLAQLNLNAYRSKIGYISQDPVIFNDSIFNNVSFFAAPTQANLTLFWKVIEMASLMDFVQSLPGKEQSVLGDNGILISGGQKQRISIARELYKQPELLVLDEATSALDAETENSIQQSIEQLKGKCTIIIIAHRLSTIRNVDKIYLLGEKKILAEGSFEELKEHSDIFKMTFVNAFYESK